MPYDLNEQSVELAKRVEALASYFNFGKDSIDWQSLQSNLAILKNEELHQLSRAHAVKRIRSILNPWENNAQYARAKRIGLLRVKAGITWVNPIGTWQCLRDQWNDLEDTRVFYRDNGDQAKAEAINDQQAIISDAILARIIKDESIESGDQAYAAKARVQAEKANNEIERILSLDFTLWEYICAKASTAHPFAMTKQIHKNLYKVDEVDPRAIPSRALNYGIDNALFVGFPGDVTKDTYLQAMKQIDAIESAHRLSPIFAHAFLVGLALTKQERMKVRFSHWNDILGLKKSRRQITADLAAEEVQEEHYIGHHIRDEDINEKAIDREDEDEDQVKEWDLVLDQEFDENNHTDQYPYSQAKENNYRH